MTYDDLLILSENPFGVYSKGTKERLPFNRYRVPGSYPTQVVDCFHDHCFWLADDWSTNFGHFLMDTAPTILEWKPGQSILCNDVTFVRELVALWRPEAHLLPLPLDRRLHYVRRLERPAVLFGHSAPVIPPHVLHFFMELRCKAPAMFNPIPKVMITRRDATRRPIANENELVAGMMKLGFIPFEFSTLSVAERICVMRQARCVFSHCGAGATNYAFISPGTTTITLYSPTLHGEEQHNSRLTRALGGVPYVLDEHGQPFGGELNSSGEFTVPWSIPSVPVILDRVKQILASI